jgi:hypothetical protein
MNHLAPFGRGHFCATVLSACSSLALLGLFPEEGRAQDSYEIQVYGSETIAPGKTMVELHSNYTIDGERDEINGVLPSHHAFHETLEITHGFTPWFETGFYVFSSIQPHEGWEWVGDHIRPRVRVPEDWNWPVGLSLSSEIGYMRRAYTEDTWSWELRPIIDKQWGRWYFALNPAFEQSIDGENSGEGFEFAPSAKISFDVTSWVAVGAEYYSSLGSVSHLDRWEDQQQQIMPALDFNLAPEWELNMGVGIGLTRSTDDLIVKLILGRLF